MSHSSETGPPARRTTTALGLLAVVLLAVAGGLLVTATTSGAAWVDPLIETPIAASSDARPTQPARAPRRSVAASARGAADATGADHARVRRPRRALDAPEPAPADPPPGRSPP